MRCLRRRLVLVFVSTTALIAAYACAKRPPTGGEQTPPRRVATPVDAPETAKTEPSPFQFDVEEINLRFGDRVVVRDQFRRQGGLRPMEVEGKRLGPTEGPQYTVNVGRLSDGNVRDGILRLDQAVTTNMSVGGRGEARRLQQHDGYIALLTLPLDVAGKAMFVAKEGFPLEYTVRLRSPRFTGFEKLKIGLRDAESFKSVAAISVGRLPLPLPPIGPGGGGDKLTNLGDIVSNPAIVLNRVEEPDILGEIVLDHAPLEKFGNIETLEMTLRVGGEGGISGLARVAAGGQVSELKLEPGKLEPKEFFARRSTLSADMRLSATLFVETLPRPEVFRVAPREVAAQQLKTAENVRLRVEGIGFGPDTRVEIVPEGVSGEAIKPATVQIERQRRGPEGVTLLVDVGLRQTPAASYSLRVTTGGQSTVFKNAVRVF